jgi:hypothetical protein
MLKNILTFLLLAWHVALFAYPPIVSATLDRTQLLIADQAKLTLEVTVPKGTQIQGFDTSVLDSLKNIEWMDKGKLLVRQENDSLIGRQEFVMQVWESGNYTIPQIQFYIATDGLPTAITNQIDFTVKTFENLDSLKINPIKPILVEPSVWQDYLPQMLGGLAVLLAIGGLIWWFNRKKQPEKVVKTIAPTLSAAQIALQKIEKLRADRLWQQGKVKEYYSELTFILREYLESQYQIQALERTSDEILAQLNAKGDNFPMKSIKALLQLADMVKFAKSLPDETAHDTWMAFLEGYLRESSTKNVPPSA